MNGKRLAAMLLAAVLLLGLSACGPRARKGSIYWLNDDPERNVAALALADRYERETGVPVKVITPAEGEYESRLSVQMARRDAPTLFTVSGAEELEQWQPQCLDLRGTKLAAALQPKTRLLRGENDSVYGLGHDTASFGLIVNTRLLERAGYRPEEIASFEDLRRVAEDIQARADALGFNAFTSAGLADGSTWRFTRQLFNLPVTLEYRDRPDAAGEPIRGTYLKQYRQLLDLYFDNSVRDAAAQPELGEEDARGEFTAGKAVFYQNGSWEYESLTAAGMDADALTMIPLYIGAKGEQDQGLCTDVTGYWCVNQNAEPANLQATLDFLAWCAGDRDTARTLGLESAFYDPAGSENAFVRADSALEAAGKQALEWNLDALPDERWERDAGRALADYALSLDEESWSRVRSALVDGWAERARKTID